MVPDARSAQAFTPHEPPGPHRDLLDQDLLGRRPAVLQAGTFEFAEHDSELDRALPRDDRGIIEPLLDKPWDPVLGLFLLVLIGHRLHLLWSAYIEQWMREMTGVGSWPHSDSKG